jgi:hypothetical protein
MLRTSSLKTRILVITAIPLSALLVGFLALTLRTADRAVHTSVSQSLSDAGSVFVKLLATRRNELLTMASVTARDPRFFATLSIPEDERGPEFAPTLQGVAMDFLRITDADFIEVYDGQGRFICYVDKLLRSEHGGPDLGRGGIEMALRGTPVTDFYLAQEHLVVAGIVPVFVSQRIEAVLRMGSFFDRQFVDEVKRLTGAEVLLDARRLGDREHLSPGRQCRGGGLGRDRPGALGARTGSVRNERCLHRHPAWRRVLDGSRARQRHRCRRRLRCVPGARSAGGARADGGTDAQAGTGGRPGDPGDAARRLGRGDAHHQSPVVDRRRGARAREGQLHGTARAPRCRPRWRSSAAASPRCASRCTRTSSTCATSIR